MYFKKIFILRRVLIENWLFYINLAKDGERAKPIRYDMLNEEFKFHFNGDSIYRNIFNLLNCFIIKHSVFPL
jgi:hypothetical protein